METYFILWSADGEKIIASGKTANSLDFNDIWTGYSGETVLVKYIKDGSKLIRVIG